MRNLLNNQDDVTSNSQALPGLEADDDRIRALWATGQSLWCSWLSQSSYVFDEGLELTACPSKGLKKSVG